LKDHYGWGFQMVIKYLERRAALTDKERSVFQEVRRDQVTEQPKVNVWHKQKLTIWDIDDPQVRQGARELFGYLYIDELVDLGFIGLIRRMCQIPNMFLPLCGSFEFYDCGVCGKEFSEDPLGVGEIYYAISEGDGYDLHISFENPPIGEEMINVISSPFICGKCMERLKRWVKGFRLLLASKYFQDKEDEAGHNEPVEPEEVMPIFDWGGKTDCDKVAGGADET
jgi:hypothetical protein